MRGVWLLCAAAMAFTACKTVPQPLTDLQAQDAVKSLRNHFAAPQELVLQPLTLYDAMARALIYNLDDRIAVMERDLAQSDYDLSGYDRLPTLIANGGSFGRTNRAGSSSLSLISGRQSLEPSTATDKQFQAGDLTASWNVLDFGLSKIRNEQLADELLISEERRRKAVAQTLRDVNRHYWRAVSYEHINTRLDGLKSDIRQAKENSAKLHEARITPPLPIISYQRDLNNAEEQLQGLLRDLESAKLELARLMGLAPNQSFALDVPHHGSPPKTLLMSFDEMIDLSLRLRSEIRETVYAKRISEKNIKKAVLETLPSLEAFAGLEANSNSFLYNANWADYGARASWNIMKVLSAGRRKDKAKAQLRLEEGRGLAAALAVMTQLGISRAQYENALSGYAAAEQGADIQHKAMSYADASYNVGAVSRQAWTLEKLRTLLSEARQEGLRADMKDAEAALYISLGYDPYAADTRLNDSIAVISASLQEYWEGLQGPLAISAAKAPPATEFHGTLHDKTLGG